MYAGETFLTSGVTVEYKFIVILLKPLASLRKLHNYLDNATKTPLKPQATLESMQSFKSKINSMTLQ